MYLDNPDGGDQEIQLIKGRINTLRRYGEEAMSPHDIRNGYTPRGIIRMMTRQLLVMMEAKAAVMGDGKEWRDHLGTMRPPYMLRDEIDPLKRQLATMKGTTMSDDEKNEGPAGVGTPNESTEEGANGPPNGSEGAQPPADASRILALCYEIRHAKATILAQVRDLRKEATGKLNALTSAEAALLDQGGEDGQLQLFDLPPEVSKEIRGIIDNPEV